MSEQPNNQRDSKHTPTVIVRKGPWLGQAYTPPASAYVEWPPGPPGGPVPGVTCPAEPEASEAEQNSHRPAWLQRDDGSTLALLTRADDVLAAEWADAMPATDGYEVLLVRDTNGDSPGNTWAVFCPSMDMVKDGSSPQDAMTMIADAIYKALEDGMKPAKGAAYDEVLSQYHELRADGFLTAEAVVLPAPYNRE